jgi:NADH:ubiquinone oxidoreductase subunit 3 (subunit A)
MQRKMKKNMSSFDRIFRVVFAVIIFILYSSNTISGGLGIILMIAAVIFMLTSFFNFCPLYSALGIHRWEKKHGTT